MTDARRQKEINKWEKSLARPHYRGYIVYLVFIITLIYTIDEIASQIGMLMKTEIANDLFARFGESSVGALEILGILVVPFQMLGLLYRPLADRFGRKLFLVINTFGMSAALFLVYISQSVALYFIGACLIQFFIPNDIHVVYIMETAPDKHRAKIFSIVKFVATLGVMLIPLLRRWLMTVAGDWRRVYFYPAVIGLAISFVALLFCQETDTFAHSRLTYLRQTEEERLAQKERQKQGNGGLIVGLKYALKNKQLRWLYIVAALVNFGFIGSINYQVILSYGYAEGLYGNFSDAAMNAVSVGAVTQALVLFPVGCALSQLIVGFVSDKCGRKGAAILSAVDCVLFFLLFYFGAKSAWSPYPVGIFCGLYIGSYYSSNDVVIMMVGESAPTHLRSSVMSAQFIITILGGGLAYAIGLPILYVCGNQVMGIISLALLVPGFVLGLCALFAKTKDTKGIDLNCIEEQ